MRNEDRLFDKRMGEVRNGDQKVRKYLFSKIFYGRQAVSYDDFFSRIIWVGGVSTFPRKNSSDAQPEDLGPSLTIQELKKYIFLVLYAAYVYTLFG